MMETFAAARELLRAAPRVPVLLQVVIEDGASAAAGLAGLLSGIRLEHPAFCGQVVRVSRGLDGPALVAGLQAAAADPGPIESRWDGRIREALSWAPTTPEAAAPSPWRTDGVHLVVGDGDTAAFSAVLRTALPGIRVETLPLPASDGRAALEASLGLLGALLPAARAARLDPVHALR